MNRCLFLLILFLFFVPDILGQANQKEPQAFAIQPKGLNISFGFYDNKFLRSQSFLPADYVPMIDSFAVGNEEGNEVFLHLTGENQASQHGAKLTGGNPGMRLVFIEKRELATSYGKQVVLVQKDTIHKLRVESYYEYSDASPTIRRYTKVFNEGIEDVGIEFLSSAILNNYNNITPGLPEENIRIHYAFNSWKAEAQWKTSKPSELGWNSNNAFNLTGAMFTSVGSWSTIRYLPMGMVENIKARITWFWHIEHNGSWHCEMSDTEEGSTYMYLGGPDAIHGDAWKNLKPGESYQTVSVALGCVKGGFDEAVAALTNYRRAMVIEPHDSYLKCPVAYNDYMKCLWAKPTTENELPLINAAARAKCDYFVIDAGWFTEKGESWHDAVGPWQPSKSRFDGGLQQLLDTIRKKGMIPGLWLEPEVVSINTFLKDKSDSWFMMQHGKRHIDNNRFSLDFRNPEVVEYMSSVVNRMVNEYGVGYIKMDYNNPTWGTETGTSSPGQGLLEQNRAVVEWLKTIRNKYPQLIIENCASGGCRMDYAMLSQCQLQSLSDQTDFTKCPAILVGALAAVVPEQLGSWTFPLPAANAREASFSMVNAMLCRIYQSGKISELSKESFDQVTKGIEIYKSVLAPFIPQSVPFFPLGMPSIEDEISPVAVGIRSGNKEFIAVWRMKGSEIVNIPSGAIRKVRLIYPEKLGIQVSEEKGSIRFDFPEEFMAAIVEVDK